MPHKDSHTHSPVLKTYSLCIVSLSVMHIQYIHANKCPQYAWKTGLWISYNAVNPLHSLHIAHKRQLSVMKSAHGRMTVGLQQISVQNSME